MFSRKPRFKILVLPASCWTVHFWAIIFCLAPIGLSAETTKKAVEKASKKATEQSINAIEQPEPETAEVIYEWQDSKGKTHYGDKHNAPEHAQPIFVPPANTADRIELPPPAETTADIPDDKGSLSPPKRRQKLSPTPQCFSRSNLYAREGETYFSINPMSLSKAQHRQLLELGNNLAGEWQGTSQELACQGSEKDWHVSRQRSSVTADLETVENSALKIRLFREASEHYNWRGDRLYLFSHDNLLSLQISDHDIIANEKYRRKTATGSSLSETRTELQLNGSGITLDTLYYVNGSFVGRETLYLFR